MEIIGCGRGHFYNPNEHSSCPQCAKENGGVDILGVTEPADFSRFSGNESGGFSTLPIDFDSFASGGNYVGVTEPVGAAFEQKNDPLLTSDFKGSSFGSKVQEYAPTAPVTPGYASGTSNIPFQPVVGWLVCIDGAAKGRDYRIHSQYNYIGRGQHMDICISGDDCISTEKAAILAYDDQEKFFSFGPGMGHNVVRVNGKMLMNAVVLQAYDQLTIGKTTLLFVPLCGERFDWNDR